MGSSILEDHLKVSEEVLYFNCKGSINSKVYNESIYLETSVDRLSL